MRANEANYGDYSFKSAILCIGMVSLSALSISSGAGGNGDAKSSSSSDMGGDGSGGDDRMADDIKKISKLITGLR